MAPNFLAWYGITTGACEIITAVLLVWRAFALHTRQSILLAAAYVCSVPLLLGNIVTTPGVLGADATFGPQAPHWFWAFYHLAWAISIAAYAWVRPGVLRRPAAAIGSALLLALGLTMLAAHADGVLPPLWSGTRAPLPLLYAFGGTALFFTMAAMVGLLRRRRSSWMDVCIFIAAVAVALDLVVAFSTHALFSLGSYAARLLGAFNVIVVFFAAVGEYASTVGRAGIVDRYAKIAEATPQIVFLQDRDGHITYMNHRWVASTGRPVGDALGDGYRASVHPDDLEALDAQRAQASARQAEFEVDVRLRAPGGAWRWHALRVVPLRDEGRAASWLGAAMDVDEGRRSFEAALHREEELRRIAAAIPQIVWTAAPDGEIDWYNDRWYDFTGQAPEEALVGRGWLRAHHPDDIDYAEERWTAAIMSGEPCEMEFRLRDRHGDYRWFLTRVVPVRNDRGDVVKWYGTNTDIDERRRQADELAKLYEREHRVAATLQRAFLPNFLPSIEGVSFDAVYRPATREDEVGGDWFDAFPLAGDRVGISIGDVIGHGMEAATAMVRVRETLRAAAGLEGVRPERVLELANRAVMGSGWNPLATAIFGILDPASMSFRFASAGHPAPFLLRGGDAEQLHGVGLPIGVDASTAYGSTTVDLQVGDGIVFYTDGLIESTRDLDEGERLVRTALLRGITRPDELVDTVLGAEQRDDVAVLVLHVERTPDVVSSDGSGWRFTTEHAASAQHARTSFTSYLRERGLSEDEITASETVFGELVGNVVRHAPGPIEIEIVWNGDDPTLAVRDRGRGFDLESVPPPDLFKESGRGLFMVRTFAEAPVVRARRGGGSEIVVRLSRAARVTHGPADETDAAQAVLIDA